MRRSSSLALADAPDDAAAPPLDAAPAVPLAAAERGQPLFFYGTLTDPDVLARVLARPVAAADLAPASVAGLRRVRAAGASYPVVLPAPGGRVGGLLLLRAGRRDIARINHYESGEYRAELRPALAAGGPRPAWLYVPLHPLPAPSPAGEPWELEAWRREHKAAFFAACDGWMADCPEIG
jgi:Gamma-glutamyl cyclotransferase, AIG2-like